MNDDTRMVLLMLLAQRDRERPPVDSPRFVRVVGPDGVEKWREPVREGA